MKEPRRKPISVKKAMSVRWHDFTVKWSNEEARYKNFHPITLLVLCVASFALHLSNLFQTMKLVPNCQTSLQFRALFEFWTMIIKFLTSA